jgi:cell division septation protein DedD
MVYDTSLRSFRSNYLKQYNPILTDERERGTVLARMVAQSYSREQNEFSETTAAPPCTASDGCQGPSSNVPCDTPPSSEKRGSTDYLPQYNERGLAAPARGYENDDGSSMGLQDVEMSDHRRWTGRCHPRVLLTSLTLVGCVILAAAAAYSFGKHAGSAPSAGPEIMADNTLNVASPAIDPKPAGELIRNPLATQGWDVEPNSPRVWLTPSLFSSTASHVAEPSGSEAAAPSSTTPDEPKRVHTLTIRIDPSGRPLDVASSAEVPSAAATPKETQDSPRALDPQQFDGVPSARPTTGGYVVQLSVQPSEARAQASFRLMQAKYPSGFSGRSPVIKRFDRGAKGSFYRVLVGPFASASDAGQFCSSLKAAGGECIIQKN